jgi:GntR family transcriptional regulator
VPRAAGEPTYRRIADDLRRLIQSGQLQTGDQLPSYAQLMEQYGVARNTIREAVGVLVTEGLIVGEHGRGIFVRQWQTIQRHAGRRLARAQWGSGHAIQDADTGTRPRTLDLVEVDEVPAPEAVAHAFGLPAGTLVVRRSRRFAVENRTVQLGTSYVPAEVARGTAIAERDTGPGGTFARLAELGHEPVRFVERLRARMPSPEETSRLELLPGTPVVAIVRNAYTADGQCIEVTEMVLDASAYELVYDVQAELF